MAPLMPPNLTEQAQLMEATSLHRQGRLPEARVIYVAILKANPRQLDALHLLGVVSSQLGDHALASALIAKAIALEPRNAAFHNNLGLALKGQGKPEEALGSFEQAIRRRPDFAEAHNNRGNALQDLKRLDAAVASYDRALALRPDFAEACNNRANALKALRQPEAALAGYDRAIALRPNYVEAHNNRGNLLLELGRVEAALADYDKATALQPGNAEAHNNRGNALRELRRLAEAVSSYDEAIRLQPGYAEALSNRGNALLELNQPEAAVASFDQAIAMLPTSAEALNNRGNALHELRQFDAAVASYDRAIGLRPDYADACNNRGNALKELGQEEAAIASYDRAIALQPGYAEAHFNRGVALHAFGQLDAAVASYDEAIRLRPDFASAHWHKSLTLLLKGDLEHGWKLYEWRWKRPDLAPFRSRFSRPAWLGDAPLAGKTILLYCEQGLGDAIQFCRYARPLAERGARVVVEAPRSLTGLLSGLEGVGAVVEKGAPLPHHDYHCSLLSLPLAFGTTLENIPSSGGYLRSDPRKVAAWDRRLRAAAGERPRLARHVTGWLGTPSKPARRRIGIAWSGSTGDRVGYARSILLSSLLPHLPDAFEYVGLQKELRDVDREALSGYPNLRYVGDGIGDFTDTAALCQLVELVITIDTSVAHLSGALGRPTWVLLPRAADWRWLQDRDDSPWYASMKLYRQGAEGTWSRVLKRVRADLLKIAQAGRAP